MSGLRRRRPGSASETPALEDTSESTGLERPSESETRMVATEGRTAQVSPFWSERARAEAVLAAARPAGLDEAAERASSARGSDSTELRADTGRTGADETRAQARAEVDELQQVQLAGPFPIGEPRSFGPGGVVAPLASVEGPEVQARESLEYAVPQDHPEDARLGMRPGERLVVEKMRDLLHDLFNQNQRLIEQQQTLQGRVDKIEDDALNPTMHSASSGGLGMLLESLPSRVKDELVVTRGMTCANDIFRVLLAYQPGGLAERQRLIQHLTDPGQVHTAKECSDCLRKWHRWLTRSQDLSVSTPDAAVLLAGLDKLCQVVMDAHAQLSFRCSISRTQHQLDFCPTLQSVTAYARLLQAEMETLSLSGADVDLDHVKKKGRVAQFQKGGKNGSKNGDSTPRRKGSEHPPPNPPREDGAKGEGKGKCRFFLNKGDCRNGGACTAEHDQAKASQMRRCFNCGAEGHRVEACNRPKGDASKGAKGTGKAPRGESATSSSASGGGGQQASPQRG